MDEEGNNIGTNPLLTDPDGDGRLDLKKYSEGTDPFTYDKLWHEHTWDFICGFVVGDFIGDTDSLSTIMGHVLSSFILFIDIRDAIGNLSHYLVKTSNSLELKEAVNLGAEVWEEGACKRGHVIDDFINKNSLGVGLGKSFPVADRLLKDERILVSRKSLDIAAQGYQKPNKLKSTLEKYANSLKNIEKDYFNKKDVLEWGKVTLNKNQYDKKALEIVLPDVIITEASLKVLKEFKETMEKSGLEV